MSTLIAKTVIKNKFWIVEDHGEKVATIQAIDNGNGVTYVRGNHRERFHNIKLLSSRYNIQITSPESKKKKQISHEVHGFPAISKPHNSLFDIHRKLPIFTKSNKSKSFYCAGHYLVLLNETWTKMYCPKLILLNRNRFFGPYKSDADLAGVNHG